MNEWERKEAKRRWEILQGQTLNMVWNDLCNDQNEDFEQKLKVLQTRYPKLLDVNAKLILSSSDSKKLEAGEKRK